MLGHPVDPDVACRGVKQCVAGVVVVEFPTSDETAECAGRREQGGVGAPGSGLAGGDRGAFAGEQPEASADREQ